MREKSNDQERSGRLPVLRAAAAALIIGGAICAAFATAATADTTDAGGEDAYVVGEYRLKTPLSEAVIDGDTIRVEGLDASLRLLSIDTEETFKKSSEETAAATNWEAYRDKKVAEDDKPVKFATPMGEKAKDFAESFFRGHSRVRLEVDDLRRKRGYYNRYLVYAFVKKNGEWVNYNLEAVRAGMTPYFSKYGYSSRFHDEFVSAQKEARKAGRGIWAKDARGYPDYKERLTWWNRRAEAIKEFRSKYGDKPKYVELGIDSEWKRLKKKVGEEVIVFGTVGAIITDKPPYRAYLSHRNRNDFAIVSFEPKPFKALPLEKHDGEYIYVKGKVSLYKGDPQFKLSNGPVKIWTE